MLSAATPTEYLYPASCPGALPSEEHCPGRQATYDGDHSGVKGGTSDNQALCCCPLLLGQKSGWDS